MKEVQENYKHWLSGLSPVLANEWGVYPTVNWRTLGGKRNWSDQWTNIIQQKSGNPIYTPPLILPVELGGCCVQLGITWNNKLTVRGYIVKDHPRYTNAPQQLDVYFKLNLSIEGIQPFVIDKLFELDRSNLDKHTVLWQISSTVDKKWPLPELTIKVKR